MTKHYIYLTLLLDYYTDIINISKNKNLKLEYINRKLEIYEEEYE